jgi:hypothetical protein
MKHIALIVALPFLLAATAGQAAPKADPNAARQKCIAEAIAAVPATPAKQEAEVMSDRTGKYVACAKRMGFKP